MIIILIHLKVYLWATSIRCAKRELIPEYTRIS
jgi:hypothetical protein